MEIRVLFFCLFAITSRSRGQSTQTFVIDKLWNGTDLLVGTNVTLSLTGTADTKDVILQFTAPFFNDAAPNVPPGPFKGIWLFESVEAFFVDSTDQYLQLEIGPYGHHFVLLLNGVRNSIRHSLPLNVNTSIDGNFWSGTVLIPGEYFPPQVAKFNAHAIHGTGDQRQYWSLYPSDSTITKPDFHTLKFSNFIDYPSISPALANNSKSALWENAFNREIKYTIDKTWNGQPIEVDLPVTLLLTNGSDPSELIVNITAPFFADPPPDGTPGQPFLGLWNYEVVELFFLNDQNQYLEVEIGPFGHHITLLLSGVRNTIRHSLPLNVSTASGRHIWQGTAVIPESYFPPNITRFNAYAIHGPATQRVYWSLYPTDGSTESPDFHNLQFFKAIDLDSILPDNVRIELSPLWNSALQGIIRYDFDTQWNGRSSNVGKTLVTLQGFQGGVEMNFTVSNNVQFMPLKYATFIFKNAKGESIKLIMLPTENHSIFLSNSTNVLLQETSTMDFRVTANDESMNGSILIPPAYFPSNVTLVNVYFTFGISVLEVISLQPTIITKNHINVAASLEEPGHFMPIDFETVIENNLIYSSKWQALVPPVATNTTESENSTEATLPEVLPKNASAKEFDLNASAKEEDVGNQNPTEGKVENIEAVVNEGVKRLLAEIKADKQVEEALKKALSAVEKVKDKIVKNEDLEVKKDTVTESEGHEVNVVGVEIKDNKGEGEVKNTDAEGSDEKTVKDTGTDVKKEEEQVEVKITGGDVKDSVGHSDVSNTDAEIKKNEVHVEAKETGADLKKHEGQTEVKDTGSDVKKEEGQTEVKNTDADVKMNEGLTEVKDTGIDVKKNQEQTEVTNIGTDVKKNEEQTEVKNTGADVKQDQGLTEVKDTGADVKKDEGQIEVKITCVDVKDTEGQSDVSIPEAEIKEDEGHIEATVPGDIVKKDEIHKEVMIKSAGVVDDGFEIKKEIVDEAVVEKTEFPFENIFTIATKKEEEELNLPSNREEAQRRIEGEISDLNVLQIPFKFSFLSQENTEESSDLEMASSSPDLGMTSSSPDLEMTSPPPATTRPKIIDIEETVDRLIDILNSGPPQTDLGHRLLPPPHPICFTPGLVADNFRCQVFYECVMEDGRWEVYNWRCKRGYFYDAEKVACVRGYC